MRTAQSPLAVVALVLALVGNALWPGCPLAAQNATGNIQAKEAEAAARVAKEAVDQAVDSANDVKARALFGKFCTAPCHGARKTCVALGRRGKNWWDITLTKMQLKGVPVDTAQKSLLVEWLWDLNTGAAPPCE